MAWKCLFLIRVKQELGGRESVSEEENYHHDVTLGAIIIGNTNKARERLPDRD